MILVRGKKGFEWGQLALAVIAVAVIVVVIWVFTSKTSVISSTLSNCGLINLEIGDKKVECRESCPGNELFIGNPACNKENEGWKCCIVDTAESAEREAAAKSEFTVDLVNYKKDDYSKYIAEAKKFYDAGDYNKALKVLLFVKEKEQNATKKAEAAILAGDARKLKGDYDRACGEYFFAHNTAPKKEVWEKAFCAVKQMPSRDSYNECKSSLQAMRTSKKWDDGKDSPEEEPSCIQAATAEGQPTTKDSAYYGIGKTAQQICSEISKDCSQCKLDQMDGYKQTITDFVNAKQPYKAKQVYHFARGCANTPELKLELDKFLIDITKMNEYDDVVFLEATSGIVGLVVTEGKLATSLCQDYHSVIDDVSSYLSNNPDTVIDKNNLVWGRMRTAYCGSVDALKERPEGNTACSSTIRDAETKIELQQECNLAIQGLSLTKDFCTRC